MQISLAEAKKLNWLWQDENELTWIETFIKAVDKSGKECKYKLTPEQRELVTHLDHKNIISKSRQLGISYAVASLSIRRAICHPNTTCVLISHSQESTNKVFAKLKQQFYSIPEIIRPKLLTNNRQELSFENGSRISCQTSGNKDLLRGDTVNGILHMSEFALWKHPEQQMQSVMQAVTESCTIIIESTSKGHNLFSKTYMDARNGENDFKPFFYNWINGGSLFIPQYKQAVKSYKARHNGQILTEDDYDDEEKYLASLGMTPEQAVWRRGKIAESSLDAFHEEYPSSFEESIVVTGSSVFDCAKVVRLQTHLLEQKVKPLAVDKIVGLPNSLRNQIKNRSLKIFEPPRRDAKYWIGVDVSEGLRQDYSTMFVMDRNGKQVASYRNNSIKPYQFSDVVNDMGRWYNNAHLTVEKASGGHSVIQRLRYEHHYMNMTKYQTYDEFKRTIWQVGFSTNNKTKSIAVNDMIEWFDKGLLDINDNDLLEEMKTFVADSRGSFNAISGCHDDLISSCWLCIQGFQQGFWYNF